MALLVTKYTDKKLIAAASFLACQAYLPPMVLAQSSLITTSDSSGKTSAQGSATAASASSKRTEGQIGPEAQFRLNALKEELNHLQRQQKQRISSLEERVRFLESQVQMLRGWSDKTIQAMRKETEKRAQAAQQMDKKGSDPTLSASEKAYRDGFDLLLSGKYQDAINAFEIYLQNYPNASNRVNAIYWIGEAYYVKEQYQQAIAQYDRLIENHSGSPKAKSARFKRAYSYYNLQDYRAARKDLLAVLEQAQDSMLEGQAKNLLDKIRSEDIRA